MEVDLTLTKSFFGCQVTKAQGLLLQQLLVLLIVGLDVKLFVALQQDWRICDWQEFLIEAEDGSFKVSEIFQFFTDVGFLFVFGSAAAVVCALGDGGSFEHIFFFGVVFLDVSVEGGVGEVGSAAGTVEIATFEISSYSTGHQITQKANNYYSFQQLHTYFSKTTDNY